ncbi:MAG: MarR family transcriptional regulator [Pseudomonadota bacterium]|nr:MarR family transcriptional regulator [Pseudomonadota bacterium]
MPKSSANPSPPLEAESSVKWRRALSAERVAHLIKHAFRGTSRALQRRLTGHDVSYGQWTLLRVLWQADGLTQKELSEAAGVTEPSTFSVVHAMEQLGYVKRLKVPGNNKQVRVFLTPKGAQLRDASVLAAEAVNRAALTGIAAEDVEITRRTLAAMIDNLARDELEGAGTSCEGNVRKQRARVMP